MLKPGVRLLVLHGFAISTDMLLPHQLTMFDIYFKGTANEILHYLKCKHNSTKFIVEFEQDNNIPY